MLQEVWRKARRSLEKVLKKFRLVWKLLQFFVGCWNSVVGVVFVVLCECCVSAVF